MIETDATFYAKLEFLISHYYRPSLSLAKNLGFLARLLSTRVHKNPAYTWRYIHKLFHRKMLPSKKILKAINIEYFYAEKTSSLSLETVSVLAPIGLIPIGTVITKEPKWCDKCGQPYVPPNNNQKHCPLCIRRKKVAKNEK